MRDTPIAGEHPLTLYVDKHELVTLMTLGAAPEALAIGYLRNQRLLDRIEDIVAVQVDWDVGAVVVKTRHGLADLEAKTQKRTTTSGCGQGTVFGDLMAEIESVRLPAGATLSQATLYALLDRVRVHETIYKQAGAVHGCALATNEPGRSEILAFVEDVGRHNAVDAIAGRMWLDRIDGADKIFYTTGRLTSEMVIKAAQMGIPFLVSRSGLTQMGFEIAREDRHHDDRPRDQQALSAVHRRRAVQGASERGRSRIASAAEPQRAATSPRPLHVRPRALRRALSVALLLPLPLRELPARALRRLRHLDRVSVAAGDDRSRRRRSRRLRVVAGNEALVLPRLRHAALLPVGPLGGRDPRRAGRVRRSRRPRAGPPRVFRGARRLDSRGPTRGAR